MRPIEVFYHVYIPGDLRATMWTWWIDQQLQLIKQSRLSSIAKINMAITMPYFWTSIGAINFTENNNKTNKITFGDKVREYINCRYPFVNIVNIRDVSSNIYEGQTLKILYDRCCEADIDVLYIHTKGVVSASASVSNWREILNHYCITEWPNCIKQLETADVVGIKDITSSNDIISGNFWWSKSSHIVKLSDPLDTSRYVADVNLHPSGPAYRYGFEKWILQHSPKIHHLVDTVTDHFDNYCFLEHVLNPNG